MLTYYPPIEPNATHYLEVTPPHVIYVEESGNPKGLPVLFVHGGPGAGTTPQHRCYFDPKIYRIILFDQRGAGKSKPHAELTNNTTQYLINDMEIIREHLGIKQWLIFGGSWGSTLGLLYAQAHPTNVLGLILRGIFLCSQNDFRWFFEYGANQIFPDHWLKFTSHIPADERYDLISAYHRRLTSDVLSVRLAAAKNWSLWEGNCATLKPDHKILDYFTEAEHAISVARIECHYFINHCFIEHNQILRDMQNIQDIPGIIVHGRYDIVCPPINAWKLQQAWPSAELHFISDAGHMASEPGNTDALIQATQKMAERFGGYL